MDYEWDETKRQANIRKHGIDFADAIKVFDGEFIETEDSRRDYGERRFRVIGEVAGDIVQVAYTWRSDRRRLISARKAGRRDRGAYHTRYPGSGSQDEKPD